MRISFELHGHGLAHRALRAIGSEDIVETFFALAVGCVDPRCGSVTGFPQANPRIAPSDRRSQIPPTARPLRFLCPSAAATAENCNDEAEPRNQSVRGIGRWRENRLRRFSGHWPAAWRRRRWVSRISIALASGVGPSLRSMIQDTTPRLAISGLSGRLRQSGWRDRAPLDISFLAARKR